MSLPVLLCFAVGDFSLFLTEPGSQVSIKYARLNCQRGLVKGIVALTVQKTCYTPSYLRGTTCRVH